MPILQGFQRSFPKEKNREIEVKNKLSNYKKIIEYWTDWQNGVSLLTGCSNINH